MLELKLVKESLFHNVLEAILDLFDVASVDCSSTGLKLQAVDTEHVAIIELLFPVEDFQHYHCDECISMGILIDDLVKAIRSADKDDTITIKVGNENFNTITLLFESPKENNTTVCDYDLLLTGANRQLFQLLDWQVLDSKYQAFVQMPSAEFTRVCKYLSNIDGPGCISVTEKGLNFFASGIIGCVNIDYMQPEEATATVVTMRAPVSLFFDVKYLNSFSKAPTLFNQVKICLSTTQPLMVECKIGQMGYIRYFLAPKGGKTEIEEEEIKTKKEIEEEEIKKNKEIEEEEERQRRREPKEKEGSKEIKGSREDKEGIKDEGIKERDGGRSKRKRRGSKKKAKIE